MNNTWIKIYRKIGDHDIIRDQVSLQIFIWILISVDYKTGLMISGRFWASQQLGINPNTFYKGLKRLSKKYDLVTLSSNNKNTTILVKNWKSYQQLGNTTGNNKVTTKQQQSNTNQEYKNKEVKNISEFIKSFNEIRGSKFKATKSLNKNFDYWIKIYSLKEIIESVERSKNDEWFNKVLTPTFLLRTRNKNGDCDYIGDLLNKKSSVEKELEGITTI